RYEPNQFEQKWQSRWEAEGLYRAVDFGVRPKYFLLDFFPYPSGEGLHVGHSKQYVATDAAARHLRMRGFNVLYPMGWDAFGLPAENEALIKQVPPAESTARNIANFKRQLDLQGTSYDWSREVNSSQPDFYRWTQWLFLLMYRRGLAYRASGLQWYCPQCKTVLANEQVENGYCWRHGDQLVERKELEQWYIKTTDYAEELLRDLDTLDWPERIIQMQRHWIGKSQGADITFKASGPRGNEEAITVFTTRPDTIYGATFLVLSPEHPLVDGLTIAEQRASVRAYQEQAGRQSEIERLSAEREKTGVATGSFAVNPFSGDKIPIWIADYVLMSYGTGAIMAVPAHDSRDHEFAAVHQLPVRQVIQPAPPDVEGQVWSGQGILKSSGPYSGQESSEATAEIVSELERRGIGHPAITYRMRDWLVSRQRYWGAPIPVVYCEGCGIVPIPEDQLPVILPPLERYEPGEGGRSPLANDPDFVDTTCPRCGGPARRETDTLDTFVDSSWYYLRYASPTDIEAPFDREKVNYWLPLDLYVGGAEHAVMHLLYFRFVAKVLADAGLIAFREPAPRLRNQGTLHGANGLRMSKSRGNVVTPDSVVAEWGADTLRGYILFMGPFESNAFWNPLDIAGVHRWLARVWDMAQDASAGAAKAIPGDDTVRRTVHKTIKRVGHDLEMFQFNTAISALMELTNLLVRQREALQGSEEWGWAIENLLLMMAPIAPYISEELWHRHGHTESIHLQAWPAYEESLTVDEVATVVIQINGKLRDRIEAPRGTAMEKVSDEALALPKIRAHLDGREIKRIVTVPDKLINIVTS
ncbi:MAG: leucine--tRNA ligase, partial [Chloroflexota bacterium]